MRNLLFVILATLLAACSSDEQEKKAAKKPLPPTLHEEDLRKFTGARTKVVWTQFQKSDKADKQGTSRHHFLYAVDSDDGRGNRKVLEAEGNYAFPIITPDGEHIVFTRKEKVVKGDKRKFNPTIEIVKFDGTGLKKLGTGYAQEVWEDPETGKHWIYAGDEFVFTSSTAPICKRIIRFPIGDPSKREVVWDRTEMGTDSFAISRDGKRFAGLFPWPQAGIGNLEDGTWEPLSNGCWTSMAPDNSYTSWVFDGAHKNIHLFEADGSESAKIRVNSHPKLKGQEVYHPRWGNDVGFMVLSGPHLRHKGKRSGKEIEIFIGKFSPEFDRIESWFQVTDNGLPDIYPDIWIEGGSAHEHQVPRHETTEPIVAKSAKWPSDPAGLVFKWQNIRAKNEFTAADGKSHVTRTEADGHAHYGPNYEMKTTGGSFHPILESDVLLQRAVQNGEFSFQGLVTADSPSGAVFEIGAYSLRVEDGLLSFYAGAQSCSKFASIAAGTPTHIVLNVAKGNLTGAFINGAPVSTITDDGFPKSGAGDELTFGRELDGRLEHLAFYNRAISAEEVTADFSLLSAVLAKRKPIQRTKLMGKLVATSPMKTVEEIAPYVRALVHYVYETDDPKFKQIAVAHWSILDSKILPGLPREIGKTYELNIEPMDAHPQLDSQAVSSEVDELLMLYYDVTPLKP